MMPFPVPEDSDSVRPRLLELREALADVPAASPGDLSDVRSALEGFQGDALREGRPGLAAALRRIGLMTEVWECLAAEAPSRAGELADFLHASLQRIGETDEDGGLSWVARESSAKWGDYISLLDPDSQEQPSALDDEAEDPIEDDSPVDMANLFKLLGVAPSVPEPAAAGPAPKPAPAVARKPEPEPEPEPTPVATDMAALLKLLGVSAPVESEPEPEPEPVFVPTRPVAAAKPVPVPLAEESGTKADDDEDVAFAAKVDQDAETPLDAELREIFLGDASELLDRMVTLVLDFETTDQPEELLKELGRVCHTMKGAAGCVGLSSLSSYVHKFEDRIVKGAADDRETTADLINEALSQIEGAIQALRDGRMPEIVPLGEGRGAASKPIRKPMPSTVEAVATLAAEPIAKVASGDTIAVAQPLSAIASQPTPAPVAATPDGDGMIRVPVERIEELMDLVSELILRRGPWAAQAETMKEFATTARVCRNRLLSSLDRLRDVVPEASLQKGLARASHLDNSPAPIDPRDDFGGLTRRLSEQIEDIAVLAETARAAAGPLSDDGDALARLTLRLWDSLQVIRVMPIRGLFQRLVRVAKDAARIEGRQVEVAQQGDDIGMDRMVQDKAFEPLLHLVRNAVGHGIESPDDRLKAGKPSAGRVLLEASREGNTLILKVQDDGRGLDYQAIATKGRRLGMIGPDDSVTPERLNALIFHSGFSTKSDVNANSGRGVGMDVVAREVAKLHGSISLESRTGFGTTVTIRLPARLALEQAMVVRIDGQPFALPLKSVEASTPYSAEDQQGQAIPTLMRIRQLRAPVIVARDALRTNSTNPPTAPSLLLIRADDAALGLVVDSLDGPRELVVKPLSPLLGGHPAISGTSLAPSGELVMMLDPFGLVRWSGGSSESPADRARENRSQEAALVVDDSISVRRVAARQLRALGMEVDEAADGVEALRKVRDRAYRLVVTDLEMPRMDGFAFLAELGKSGIPSLPPVIVSSTMTDAETRRRVLELGARAFVAKPFGPGDFAKTIRTLLPDSPAQETPALV